MSSTDFVVVVVGVPFLAANRSLNRVEKAYGLAGS